MRCTVIEPKAGAVSDVCACIRAGVCIFLSAQERLPWLRWKEQMGGGSGLLCLRNTVALRSRVPPTFHPGPQLPTTAHGARPAPAHHGPAPRAICLLGQTSPPILLHSVASSPGPAHPPPRHPHSEPEKQAKQLHWRYVLLFGALRRQKELEEMSQRQDREPNCVEILKSKDGALLFRANQIQIGFCWIVIILSNK